MFSTRRGAVTTAIVAALLAAIILYVFVQNYQKGGSTPVANTPVFVSTGYIPRGTPMTVIASESLLSRTTVPQSHVVTGAISDPSVLKGEATAQAIYPGQQLTAADFTTASASLASQLTGDQRAIAVPVDSAHGLVGFVETGDHVDVMSSISGGNATGAVHLIASNIVVLAAPGGTTSGGLGGGGSSASAGGNIVLQVTAKQAAQLAFASDNSKIWIFLRPPVGALGTTNSVVKK